MPNRSASLRKRLNCCVTANCCKAPMMRVSGYIASSDWLKRAIAAKAGYTATVHDRKDHRFRAKLIHRGVVHHDGQAVHEPSSAMSLIALVCALTGTGLVPAAVIAPRAVERRRSRFVSIRHLDMHIGPILATERRAWRSTRIFRPAISCSVTRA